MNRKEIYSQIKGLIQGANNILISGHHDPDGDSLGTLLALRRHLLSLDKNVTAIKDGDIPNKYSFLPDVETVEDIKFYKADKAHDLIIILESSSIGRAGNIGDLIDKSAKIINIDHHPDNDGYGDVYLQDTLASSVGEIIYEYFEDLEYKIDKETAIQLYTAILTDTGRFRFSSTTRRTMEIAGRLIEAGADPRSICDKVYYSQRESTLKLTGLMLNDMDFHEGGRICFMYLTPDKINKSGAGWDEVEGLADMTLFGEKAVLGGFLKARGNNLTKVSLRSRGQYDVSALAHKYNGGGHVNASGCEIRLSLKDAADTLLNDMKGMLK